MLHVSKKYLLTSFRRTNPYWLCITLSLSLLFILYPTFLIDAHNDIFYFRSTKRTLK